MQDSNLQWSKAPTRNRGSRCAHRHPSHSTEVLSLIPYGARGHVYRFHQSRVSAFHTAHSAATVTRDHSASILPLRSFREIALPATFVTTLCEVDGFEQTRDENTTTHASGLTWRSLGAHEQRRPMNARPIHRRQQPQGSEGRHMNGAGLYAPPRVTDIHPRRQRPTFTFVKNSLIACTPRRAGGIALCRSPFRR